MATNQNLSQRLGVATHITPSATRAAGSYVTPAIDGYQFARAVALLQIGTLDGAATVNARWQACSGSVSSLAGWADVNSAALTSSFASASNDKLGLLELRVDQYPSLERYLRVKVTTATSTWTGAVIVLGEPSLYEPASQFKSADVVQTTVY